LFRANQRQEAVFGKKLFPAAASFRKTFQMQGISFLSVLSRNATQKIPLASHMAGVKSATE
jgi:hypothetical protein